MYEKELHRLSQFINYYDGDHRCCCCLAVSCVRVMCLAFDEQLTNLTNNFMRK